MDADTVDGYEAADLLASSGIKSCAWFVNDCPDGYVNLESEAGNREYNTTYPTYVVKGYIFKSHVSVGTNYIHYYSSTKNNSNPTPGGCDPDEDAVAICNRYFGPTNEAVKTGYSTSLTLCYAAYEEDCTTCWPNEKFEEYECRYYKEVTLKWCCPES